MLLALPETTVLATGLRTVSAGELAQALLRRGDALERVALTWGVSGRTWHPHICDAYLAVLTQIGEVR